MDINKTKLVSNRGMRARAATRFSCPEHQTWHARPPPAHEDCPCNGSNPQTEGNSPNIHNDIVTAVEFRYLYENKQLDCRILDLDRKGSKKDGGSHNITDRMAGTWGLIVDMLRWKGHAPRNLWAVAVRVVIAVSDRQARGNKLASGALVFEPLTSCKPSLAALSTELFKRPLLVTTEGSRSVVFWDFHGSASTCTEFSKAVRFSL
ncbi:hypothetical protein ACLOJK_024852 [Asimina triloba]